MLKNLLPILTLATVTATATAVPPRLLSSEPANAATGVAVDVGLVRCRFDRNMKMNGWSLMASDKGEFPPLAGDDATQWTSPKCFELRLATLKPDTTYAIQLNSINKTGFSSAMENEPLPVTVITFRTAARSTAPTTTAPAPQVSTDTGTMNHPILGAIPGVTVNAPPPHWIRPGLRLTYHTIQGSVPHGPWEYRLNENGGWEDKEGRRYSRERANKSGSAGYLQANLIALNEREAAVQLLFYLFDGLDPTTSMQKIELGYVESASMAGDLWIHPDALKELAAKHGNSAPPPADAEGIWISRVKKTIDQATYEGLQIVSMTRDSRGVWVFDMASGVMLYSSSVTSTGPTVSEHNVRTAEGGSIVRYTTFKGSRNIQTPWMAAQSPSWLGKINSFKYEGTFNVVVPGSPPTPLGFSVDLKASKCGPDWMMFTATATSQGPGALPSVETRVSGNAQIGGLWIPAWGMTELQQGQVIDQDPFTNFVTRVSHIDNETATITLTGPRQQFDYTYRRTNGMLLQLKATDFNHQIPGMSNVLQLDLVGSQ